jgi:hypothetical protein
MSKPVYAFVRGSHRSQEDASAFAEEVLALRVQLGREIKKEDVLDAARPSASRLHHLFTWDDSAAAEKWRLEEAGFYLRSIVVRVEGHGGPVERRLLVAIAKGEQDEPHEYVARTQALSDDDLRSRLVEKALHEIEQWQERYQELSEEFPLVFKAIGETIERMVR